MILEDGQFGIAPGHLAVVVTHLVCHAPMPMPERPVDIELNNETGITPEMYLRLFRMIGRDWLWTSRLLLEEDELASILKDPDLFVYTVRSGSKILGMVEYNLYGSDTPRISFFGLVTEASGCGIGRWLMSHFQHALFSNGAQAIRLDTCTLDSPGALAFYLRNGFEAERREVRVFPDPRTIGLLDIDAAPFVPQL